MPDYSVSVPFLGDSPGRWKIALHDNIAAEGLVPCGEHGRDLTPRLTLHANPKFKGAHGRASTLGRALEALTVRVVLAA